MILQREVLQKRIFKHAWTDKNRRNDMGAENTEYGADQIQILEGLEELRKRDFYLRQDDHARKKLELHFCIHTQ